MSRSNSNKQKSKPHEPKLTHIARLKDDTLELVDLLSQDAPLSPGSEVKNKQYVVRRVVFSHTGVVHVQETIHLWPDVCLALGAALLGDIDVKQVEATLHVAGQPPLKKTIG